MGSFLIFPLAAWTQSASLQNKHPKEKVNPGFEYFFAFQESEMHLAGLVLNYKKVDLSLGGIVQYRDPNDWNNSSLGYPKGLYLNVHYAGRKKDAIFKFTFDFITTHIVSDYIQHLYYYNPQHGPSVTMRSKISNTMISMGPGVQFRLIKGCSIRLAAMPNLFQSFQFKFTNKDSNGETFSGTTNSSTLLFPDEFQLTAKLGITYVFSY
jgi:hypothetical protein